MIVKLMIVLSVHIIGAICSIILDIKTGVFEEAAKHGDGIRFANPSDVLFMDLFAWEIEFFVYLFSVIDYLFSVINYGINAMFQRKYMKK